MKTLFNVSNHKLSEMQMIGYNVIEVSDELKSKWSQMTPESVDSVVSKIVAEVLFTRDMNKISGDIYIHIAGYPAGVFKMVQFCDNVAGLIPIYSHSVRVSNEKTNPDGSVVKTNVFIHSSWFNYLTNEGIK